MERMRTELARRLPALLDRACLLGDPPSDLEALIGRCERRCAMIGAEADLASAAVAVVGEQLRLARLLALAAGGDPGRARLVQVAAGCRCGEPLVHDAGCLAEEVARALARSLVVRAVPSGRAPALALWGAWSTAAVARRARALLDGVGPGSAAQWPRGEVPSDQEEVGLAQRLVILSNLVKAGRAPREEDLRLLRTLLRAASLPEEVDTTLRGAFAAPRQHPVDFEALEHPEQALALAMDLVAVAWRDGEPAPREREYALRVSARVGVPVGLLLWR